MLVRTLVLALPLNTQLRLKLRFKLKLNCVKAGIVKLAKLRNGMALT